MIDLSAMEQSQDGAESLMIAVKTKKMNTAKTTGSVTPTHMMVDQMPRNRKWHSSESLGVDDQKRKKTIALMTANAIIYQDADLLRQAQALLPSIT